MSDRPADTKLARRLQKRGTWSNYSNCLRAVQRALLTKTTRDVLGAIDRGELDPPKGQPNGL